jgi:AcrR family transcriptional regulator
VTTRAADVAPTGKALELVLTAERLFATHGIDGVSLRQISSEAGSGNNSAVHYHFGSKQGLIGAIFRHRLPQLISERRMLAARCDPDDLRSRVEAHFLPVFTLADTPGTHYVSFVEQLQRHDLGSDDSLIALPPEGLRSQEEFRRDLERLLADLDEPLRQLRIVDAQSLCIHAAADRERAVAAGIASTPFDLYVNAFLDGITGYLSAPASRPTQRRLDQAPTTDHLHLRAL